MKTSAWLKEGPMRQRKDATCEWSRSPDLVTRRARITDLASKHTARNRSDATAVCVCVWPAARSAGLIGNLARKVSPSGCNGTGLNHNRPLRARARDRTCFSVPDRSAARSVHEAVAPSAKCMDARSWPEARRTPPRCPPSPVGSVANGASLSKLLRL